MVVIKRFISLSLLIVWLSNTLNSYAQNPYGTTGLLRMPSAEMQKDKTFMLGATYLPKEGTQPHRASYDTYNYFLNLTIFPWMEVAYSLTLNQGIPGGYWPPKTYGKFVNQDRSFHVKFRLWKEGDWKPWMPQIAIGANDPITHTSYGGGSISTGTGEKGTNNYLTRWYVAAAKHFDFGQYGLIGVHGAWVWDKSKSKYAHYSRPAFGIQYSFQLKGDDLWHRAANGLSLLAEYDARTINVGVWYDFPAFLKTQNGNEALTFHSYAEMNQCKYLTTGILFKIHLK